ncbi:RING finger protein 17 isoform X2 [Solea solea]|uniref:RING finger protein 17 isoform X2 n=1 Tax=Solea solea TaxID=90069 RepID=UPI002729809B|nr:RING finger protein 17 isoform X2 [Solea solea]
MNTRDSPSAVACHMCGEAFILPEDDTEGNLPRVLLCGHIYCTSCLQSLQCDDVIQCPDCEVETTLPRGGVFCLQEDSRIIGLIYTAKINKMKSSQRGPPKTRRRSKFLSTDLNDNCGTVEQPAEIENIQRVVDETLAQADKNLAQLERIYETLSMGLAEQVEREKAHLGMEIKQATDKAVYAVQKWRSLQLNRVTDVEAHFATSQAEVCRVQGRVKALENAIQMAREVRRVPFLEQYCVLDKVLETLQAPVDHQSFDMKCITLSSGMRCVFQSETLEQGLTLTLKMDVGSPKLLSEFPLKGSQSANTSRKSPLHMAEDRKRQSVSPSQRKFPSPQRKEQENTAASGPPSRGSSPTPRPRRWSSHSRHSSGSDVGSQDVIVEELLEEGIRHAPPPTGPELANDRWRFNRKKKHQLWGKKTNVTQWVVVSHIVNPSHFYVCYVAEKREREMLSKKINHFCHRESCLFTPNDKVETGSTIFVKWKDGLWWRASVIEVFQRNCAETVKACKVTQLASIQIFFLDYGVIKRFTIFSEEAADSVLKAVNKYMRKVHESVKMDLRRFAPQAIRCSLKDLVPYDLTKGWGKEAIYEFRSVVGSATVEMRPLGQDRDSLLVDLKKAPMDQSSDVPISVREYLIFIEVARFYSPVIPSRNPLLYYPPVYPIPHMELDAVVSHINNPADFYIQLVENMESLLLSCKLQDCYSAETEQDDLNVYCPAIGQACVARYDDQLWYRAQVTGHPGGRKVEVRFVDFGNVKILSVSDLKKIKDEFFALPSMAIHCCLSDVIPLDGATWSDACTDRFISLAHQKLVTIVAKGKGAKSRPLPLQLYVRSHDEQINISELLVKEELASFKDSSKSKPAASLCDDSAIWDPPLELGSAEDGADSPEPKITEEKEKDEEELLDLQLKLKLPAQLKDLKVRVSHVNSPSSFYVQLAQYDSQLKRICELVKQECALTEPQEVLWKAEMFCAAHINGVWERGRICSDITSNNIAEVIRCDHGNVVKIDIRNLRPLSPSLVGSLALECTLTDIRPAGGKSSWTATACDVFSYYLTGVSAVVTIKELTDERPAPVTLFCSNKKGQLVSISDFLASEGLALRERKSRDAVVQKPNEAEVPSSQRNTQDQCSDGENQTSPQSPGPAVVPFTSQSSVPSISCPPKPAPRRVMTAEMVKTRSYDPPELPCLGHIQINVSAVGDDGLIYTRTQNAECQLEQLRERIQQSMKTLPNQKPYTWKSVQGCAVIGPDMLWYRGQLVEVLGGHVKVQYVDFGLVENIPVVHVYPILLCDDVPQLCMPCQLHGINPVGGSWQREAVALMREMLVNRCVNMIVVELPSDPRRPLTVELFLDGLSLSKVLCHHEHASMDRTVSAQKGDSLLPSTLFLDDWDIDTEGVKDAEEPVLGPFIRSKLPEKEQHFPVRVKHLWTPNELFLWPLEETIEVKVDGETLTDALTRINDDLGTLSRLGDFPQGGPCLAEYSDGKFYRAKIMEITSVEPVMVLVQHVDFGSYDTLPTSRLRQMLPELLRFPMQVLKVKVADLKAPGARVQGEMLPYSPKWSVKAVLDMIDLLDNNVTTACIVAHEPELTVRLYNKHKELVYQPLVKSGLAELE